MNGISLQLKFNEASLLRPNITSILFINIVQFTLILFIIITLVFVIYLNPDEQYSVFLRKF